MSSIRFDRRRGLRLLRNTAIVVVALLLVLGVLGYLAGPGLVQRIAEEQIATQLGRKATIGSVDVNPLRLAVTVHDFTLFEPDGVSPAVQADALLVNVSSASLFRRALVFDAIRLARPRIAIVRLAPNRYDFSDIVERLAAKPKTDDATPRYSLNNIEIDDGSVTFDDRVTGTKHVVDRITLGVPFLSNLPYATDVYVTPGFSARVDGSTLRLDARAQPFADRREARVEANVDGLDLSAYAGFVPARVDAKLVSGKLDMRLTIDFRAAGKDADGHETPQSLVVAGPLSVTDLRIADASGRDVLSFAKLAVVADRIEPLRGTAAIASVTLDAPQVRATRRADGSIDLATLVGPRTDAAPTDAPRPDASRPDATDAKPAPSSPPDVTIERVTVAQGRIDFADASLATPATTTLDAIALDLGHVSLAGTQPTTYALSFTTPGGGSLETHGSALVARRSVTGAVGMKHIQPGAFASYLAGFVAARVGSGTIDGEAKYAIDASGPALAAKVTDIQARVEHLQSQLPNEKASFVAAESIVLANGAFDLATHAFTADALTLTAPVLAIARDRQGRFNLQAALIAKTSDAPPAAPMVAKSTNDATPPVAPAVVVAPADAHPFTASIRTFSIARGDLSFADDAGSRPVRIRVAPFDLAAEGVGTATDASVPFKLDATVEQRGRLAVKGKVTPSPLALDASVDATRMPVGWLSAYAGERLNIVVEDADLGLHGVVKVQTRQDHGAAAALATRFRGSAGIERMRALDRVTSQEFIRWKKLDLPKLDVDLPGGDAPPVVSIGDVTLDDFYARLIVNANGRLNVQDVVTPAGQRRSVTTPEADAPARPAGDASAAASDVEAKAGPDAASSSVASDAAASSKRAKPTASSRASHATVTTVASAPPAATSAMPRIRIDGIRLTGGRVGFTDNFVKPNYSVDLSSLDGSVGTLSSTDPKPATLRIAGRIDGDGTLDVQGSVDPFARSLFVDLQADAKDIELTRLTPYTVKYAGYPVERGKLSTTVRYHIEDGRLTAQNRLFLDQLTFGDRDPSSAANLPVRLAVALLKNSKGEIDVNLPVAGSLSDPQFSIGGVIFRALVNLVVRAATSPFALIGSAFGGGGGGELGYIQFAPGVSDLTPQGTEKLATLAKALADRPQLRLDIIGRYDPKTDPDGIRRDHLLDRLKDAKAKALSKPGATVRRDDVTIAPDEYAKYLTQVYDDTKLADKPRNLIGLAKTVPVAEMERLLLADIKLDPNDPRWLAEARADVVRHRLEDAGGIAASRLFLVAPRLDAKGITDGGAPNRVDFALR